MWRNIQDPDEKQMSRGDVDLRHVLGGIYSADIPVEILWNLPEADVESSLVVTSSGLEQRRTLSQINVMTKVYLRTLFSGYLLLGATYSSE